MIPIQLILLALIAFVCVVSLRSRVVTRITAITMVGIAATAIVYPELTNQIAHLVGVGRGADLLLYLISVGSAYGILSLYARTRYLERTLTELARNYALEHARPAEKETSSMPVVMKSL